MKASPPWNVLLGLCLTYFNGNQLCWSVSGKHPGLIQPCSSLQCTLLKDVCLDLFDIGGYWLLTGECKLVQICLSRF